MDTLRLKGCSDGNNIPPLHPSYNVYVQYTKRVRRELTMEEIRLV